MTKPNSLILLGPIAFFLLAAIAVFIMSNQVFKNASIDRDHQKKFDAFASDVHTGRVRLTVGQWLDNARHEDALVEDYRQASITAGKMMQIAGWAIVAGIVFQVICLFLVLNKTSRSQ
jgi:hypothetical protein